jgi:hypothetical protein
MYRLIMIFGFLLFGLLAANAQGFHGSMANQAFGGYGVHKKGNNEKLQVDLQLGSMFFSDSQYGSGFGTYVSPVVGYPVNDRLRLRFGTTVYQGFGHTLYHYNPAEGTFSHSRHDISTATVFVSGSYDINPNLTIFGSAYKQLDLRPAEPAMNPQAINFEREGFTAGFNLRLTEYMQINGMIDYSRGSGLNQYNPYYHTPGRFDRSPFIW